MIVHTVPNVSEASRAISTRLNRNCFCITLDRAALYAALDQEVGEPGFCEAFMKSRPNLFSNVPVFLAASVLGEMGGIVDAIECATKLPAYRDAVLSWAPAIAQRDFGPAGALMGYDFHLDDDGPKLIEVNTNAGGAFLDAFLAKAQKACCAEVEQGLISAKDDKFETAVAASTVLAPTLTRRLPTIIASKPSNHLWRRAPLSSDRAPRAKPLSSPDS
jgi:hypothetical protein